MKVSKVHYKQVSLVSTVRFILYCAKVNWGLSIHATFMSKAKIVCNGWVSHLEILGKLGPATIS